MLVLLFLSVLKYDFEQNVINKILIHRRIFTNKWTNYYVFLRKKTKPTTF